MNIKRNIIFSLESRKKNGVPIVENVPIRMRVIFASQRIEFTTGYRIDAAKWDTDKQRVKPANATFTNTYVPMTHEEMMLRAAAEVYREKRAREDFDKYSRTAYEYLQKKQIGYFTSYANAALSTGYYNSQLYYNLGISYYLSGQKRKGKKFLKKALKKGFLEANRALFAIKKKEILSYSWFIY